LFVNKSLVNKSLVVVHESPAGRLFLRLSLELLSGSLSNFLPHSHICINPLLTATSLVHTLEVVLQVWESSSCINLNNRFTYLSAHGSRDHH
jgi:hypothetical protein